MMMLRCDDLRASDSAHDEGEEVCWSEDDPWIGGSGLGWGYSRNTVNCVSVIRNVAFCLMGGRTGN